MKRLLLVLLLLATPAAAQWPGPPGLLKSGVVNVSKTGVSCTETCGSLTCTNAYRETTVAALAQNDLVQGAFLVEIAQQLLPANWAEGFDNTGEFIFTGSNNAMQYVPLVSGNSVVVDVECTLVGTRSGGGNNQSVFTQIARGTGGLDPTISQGVSLIAGVSTPNDGSAFSLDNQAFITLAENETIGVLVSGSVQLTIDQYFTRCTITRTSATASTDCTDTFDVRRCVCE